MQIYIRTYSLWFLQKSSSKSIKAAQTRLISTKHKTVSKSSTKVEKRQHPTYCITERRRRKQCGSSKFRSLFSKKFTRSFCKQHFITIHICHGETKKNSELAENDRKFKIQIQGEGTENRFTWNFARFQNRTSHSSKFDTIASSGVVVTMEELLYFVARGLFAKGQRAKWPGPSWKQKETEGE